MSPTHVVLYIRELPGGGFVSIEGELTEDGPGYLGTLRVERRSEAERRDGHRPPVVLRAVGTTQGEIFHRLVAVADSNVAVATAMLRWQAENGGADNGGATMGAV